MNLTNWMKWNKWKLFGKEFLLQIERIAEHKILLYQIDGFYVEVYYNKEHNDIRKFRSFSSTNQLDPYLGQIDLTGKF